MLGEKPCNQNSVSGAIAGTAAGAGRITATMTPRNRAGIATGTAMNENGYRIK